MEKREYNWLDRVDSPRDLKRLSLDELRLYCDELRHYIIEQCAVNPGHLASSLGAVELAAAVHYVFDTPDDRLVWDVGHQAYAHKIITGRREAFRTNRKLGGISGFPRIAESPYDAFGGGHSSVSISAAFGMAKAAELRGEKRQVIAVIGDGAMTGGLASGFGSMLFDFTNPLYIAESWITFITKFFIGFLAGLIAHRSGNISLGRDVLGASVGSVTYVALYLLKSFIMKFYIEGQALGAVQTQLVTKGVTSLINAVLAVVVSVLLAKAVRPALRKAGILSE